MGKGNRNDRQKIENQSASEERFLQKQKAQKSKKRSDKVIAAACVVIALIVVAILVLNVFNETGVFLRMQNVASLEDVTVDKAMMTFFVNDYIRNWNAEYINYVNQYYYYFLIGSMKTISLDLSKDLDDQKITQDDVDYYLGDSSYVGLTWFEYFRDQVISTVEMYVTYANGANAQGITLDDEDKKDIDEIIEKLKSDLKKQGLTISDVYGKGVSESDVRKCYELIYLASAFGEKNKKDIEDVLKTDQGSKDIRDYRDTHKEKYQFAKYMSFSISLSEKNFNTQEEYDSAVAAAKEAIDKIALAKHPKNFLKYIENYLENPIDTGSTETTTESKKEETTKPAETTGTESTEETETTDPLDKYTYTIYYDTEKELGKWIFDESEPANIGDVKIIEETGSETAKPSTTESESKSSKSGETETESSTDSKTETSKPKTYETFKITIYMLRNLPQYDTSLVHYFSYVITDDKAAADKFLSDFNALKDEEKTRDKFYDMADDYYQKNYANHDHTDEEHEDHQFEYDKVDEVKEKYFNSTYDKLNKWLDEDDRVNGSYTDEYIEITTGTGENKVTYYVILYFERHGGVAWLHDVFDDLTQVRIDEWYKAEIEENPVKIDKNAFTDITVVKYESSSEQ